MIKKTYLIIFAIAIVVFAIFTVPKVIAGVCNDFIITFDSVSPGLNGGFIYKYSVTDGTKPTSKLSWLEFAIDASLTVRETTGSIDQHPAGAGGKNGWLQDDPNTSVVTITPQVNRGIIPVEFEVFGSGGQVGDIGLLTKSGKSEDTCLSDGAVPGLSPYTSCPEHKVMEDRNGVAWYIDIEPDTCCPDPVNPVVHRWDQPNGPYVQIDSSFVLGSDEEEGPLTPIVIQGINDDPRCPIVKLGHGPASCEWISVGGWPVGPLPPCP